ncbi:hypothetical protein P8452_31991 [Trifolium repens]|nr:hypothetical protein P8452_31991 [Trifolium repens]
MEHYKWEAGTLFSTKDEFKFAIRTYSVHSGKNVKFGKNDNERIRAVCRDACKWFVLCAKLKDEDTWQIRTKNDEHTCPPRDYNIKLLNAKWLGNRLIPTIKENPNIKCIDIYNKAHQKWHSGVSRMKAYRAKRVAIDMVDGSFKAQFLRLHDYCNEVIKSNPFSTVKLTVQNTEVVVGQDIIVEDYVDRPMLPSFQRLYMCLDGCGQRICKTFTFISDQQKGLLPAMEELLPGFCQILRKNWRKNNSHVGSGLVGWLEKRFMMLFQ